MRDDWISFINCWKKESEKFSDPDEGFFLRFDETQNAIRSTQFTHVGNLNLPQSFIDFHYVYSELGGQYRNVEIEDGIGIFAPEDVQLLSQFSPDLLKIKNEWPDESGDDDYFRYGVEQDNSAVRTSYQNNAIVVGQYGFSDYELVVLYPDSTTIDGEMEASIFAQASETRTPSFAEMLRQLSYYFTKSPDSIPIYSQQDLTHSCASRLSLRDVWWK